MFYGVLKLFIAGAELISFSLKMGSFCSIYLKSPGSSFQNVVGYAGQDDNTDLNSKALILGTSNSGKSTVFRQMQILNTEGFSKAERQMYQRIISENIISSINTLISEFETAGTSLVNENTGQAIDEFKQLMANRSFALDLSEESQLLALSQRIWSDSMIQEIFELCRDQLECPESMALLLSEVDVICCEDFVPTNKHILHSRLRTTGVRTLTFFYEKVPIQIIDVGGQRSERRKWIHHFDDVELLLFCAAVNEFDMVHSEDNTRTAMEESLEVFRSIINSPWFQSKTIVLFLNKVDLLQAKLAKVPVTDYFDDFDGDPKSEKDVLLAIKTRYLSCDEQKGRKIFTFNTCATNTENIEYVSKACFDTLLRNRLAVAGLD